MWGGCTEVLCMGDDVHGGDDAQWEEFYSHNVGTFSLIVHECIKFIHEHMTSILYESFQH